MIIFSIDKMELNGWISKNEHAGSHSSILFY